MIEVHFKHVQNPINNLSDFSPSRPIGSVTSAAAARRAERNIGSGYSEFVSVNRTLRKQRRGCVLGGKEEILDAVGCVMRGTVWFARRGNRSELTVSR